MLLKLNPLKLFHNIAVFSLIAGTCFFQACTSPDDEASAASDQRLVTLGSQPAETVIALGVADRLVGMDQSAAEFAEGAPGVEMLNYHRQTSSEGVLSLRPTHLILTDSAGPDTAIRQIESAGIQTLRLPEPRRWEDVIENIRRIGTFLGREDAAEAEITRMEQMKSEAEEKRNAGENGAPRVLFVLSATDGGNLLCAGQGSAADAVIRMAGGENVAAEVEGYKPLSREALLQLNPTVILVPSGGPHWTERSADAIRGHAGLAASEAVQQGRVHGINLARTLGFGPSLAPQLVKLTELFYPDADYQPSAAAGM